MYCKKLDYENLDSAVVNAILSFYANIKALIQKKNIAFSFESMVLGVGFEVSYHDGIFDDFNFLGIKGSISSNNIKALYKDMLIKAVENSYLNGIPYKIKELDDIRVRGIITLNKNEFIRFFKNELSMLLEDVDFIHLSMLTKLEPSYRDNIVFLKNLIELCGMLSHDWLLDRTPSTLDVIFCCLMLNYPYQSYNKCIRFYRDYPTNINKNLYEFIAVDTVKSNQQSSSNIDGFNYYSEYFSSRPDFTTTVKKDCMNLTEILNYLRSLINGEMPLLYMGAMRLTFKGSNKKDHEKVRQAELVEQINFNFYPPFNSLAFNPENKRMEAILDQLDSTIDNLFNLENACNNYKTIHSTFEVFSENNIALGDLGEIISSYVMMAYGEGYVPLNHIDIKYPSNPESNRHGIDHIYERTNPETNTKEWLIIETKVNESRLGNEQATKQWIKEKLKTDVTDSRTRTEIETAYNEDPSRVSVGLLRLDLTDFQNKIKADFYNTPIRISLSKLNDAAEIEQTESIDTKLTVSDLAKNTHKFKNFFIKSKQ